MFVNAVACLAGREGATPEGLLDALQDMERRAGRRPKRVMNEPRPLDLDLLAWDAMELDMPRLVLPHPRAHLRRFVLAPWAELAPDFVVPRVGRTVAALLAALETHETLRRIPNP
jgi:2-amino-4-hydroxy-6-hydroxymethyldihydropteridine diphosphokinase